MNGVSVIQIILELRLMSFSSAAKFNVRCVAKFASVFGNSTLFV